MAKTLGPVVLKHGDKDILKMHSGTPIKSLLQQLEKACKDGRVQDSEGYDVGPEYSKDLPGGDYLVIMHSTAGVGTLDDIGVIAAATAREIRRLQQEEESDIISCVASHTSYPKAKSAAHRLGFDVKGVDCLLPPNAEERPLQPAYYWEDDEDSKHEKPKILSRLSQELDLCTKELQATAVFGKFLGKVNKSRVHLSAKTDIVIHHKTEAFIAGPSELDRCLMTCEIKTTTKLKGRRDAAEGQALVEFLAINISTGGAGWGIPVVLSDLTEACVFQRGKETKDIIQMRFRTLEQAYAYIRWLLDEAKERKPLPLFDASCGPPAANMSTIWEEAETSSQDDVEDSSDECVHASLHAKNHIFKQQLELLMAHEPRIGAYLEDFTKDKQRMPNIMDFVPSIS